MPASECAVPSRPRVRVEPKSRELDGYTFPRELAREWLGCTPAEMSELVRRSRVNASRGHNGPLELVNGGQSFTLSSVFAYRRSTALTH